jgi:hypothetical protein
MLVQKEVLRRQVAARSKRRSGQPSIGTAAGGQKQSERRSKHLLDDNAVEAATPAGVRQIEFLRSTAGHSGADIT